MHRLFWLLLLSFVLSFRLTPHALAAHISYADISTDPSPAEEFTSIVPADAKLQTLGTKLGFTEGPVWFDDSVNGGYLLFSDEFHKRMMRWSQSEGISVFRPQSNWSNGNFKDMSGRLITCEQSTRGVSRTEADGTVTMLVDHFQGKRFNAPNDVVVKSDGSIWFTDPAYGVQAKQLELTGDWVFRFDPETKQIQTVATDFDKPNGLCFSPDEKRMYIDDSGKLHHVRVFDVQPDGSLTGGNIFCVISPGVPDGMRVDETGRLFVASGDGVHVFRPDGTLLGNIATPTTAANVCFGEKDRRTLFITARGSLFRIDLNDIGALTPAKTDR